RKKEESEKRSRRRRFLSFTLYQVAKVMNTRVGRYLSSHPFLALTVMLFSAMAALPVGLFLLFALVTIIMSTAGFFFFECKCTHVTTDL
uniref:Uncharacterized protein n=1 Tax=Mastacembelus armatus TaxID=205130 RepID=A0A7N9AKN5_9TELE